MWKENILPRLIPELSQLASVKVYMVVSRWRGAVVWGWLTLEQMYHEATICNLLEVLMYHSRLCTSAEGAVAALMYGSVLTLRGRVVGGIGGLLHEEGQLSQLRVGRAPSTQDSAERWELFFSVTSHRQVRQTRTQVKAMRAR